MVFLKSASPWAVVRKHGKLSRMCTQRLRIIANSGSCSGWSSRKKVFHTDEKCRTSTGAPTSATNELSSSAIEVTHTLRHHCICQPCALKCLSTDLSLARATEWHKTWTANNGLAPGVT